MSSRAQRVGVAEAKADLARLEEASRGSSAGARLLARLDRVKAAAGVPLDLEVERVDLAPARTWAR